MEFPWLPVKISLYYSQPADFFLSAKKNGFWKEAVLYHGYVV